MSTRQQGKQSSLEDPLKPFRPGLSFGFFNAITWQIALGTPMVLFAERLGASTFIVGLVYSFVFLLTPIQMLSAFLIPKFGYKPLMLACWALRSLFLFPLIWIAWREPDPMLSWPLLVFVICIFAFCFFRAIGGSAQVPWFYAILPEKSRGRFFASDQIFSSISSIATLCLCAFLFNYLDLFRALFWEFLLAFGGSVLSLICLASLGDAPKPKPQSVSQTGKIAKSYLAKPSNYRYYLGVHLLLACCSTSLPPFATYFLKVVQNVSPSQILSLVALQSIGVIISATLVKRTIDSVGPRSIFILALILIAVLACMWSGILQGYLGGFAIYAICYILMGAGACLWFTANINYMPHLMQAKERHIMLAINASIVSVVSGLAPVLWGFLLKDQSGPTGTGMNLAWFRVYFVSLFTVSICLIPIIARIRVTELDHARPFRLAAELWRPFRAITLFTSNYPDAYDSSKDEEGES
ncbi:MAG: MFS transporter [Opitutaceae bacterium]|nr:MFS transporter [Opitutaceae bacterium]